MFARFKIEAITSSEDSVELVGVGVAMPTGEVFVDWRKPEVVNRKEMDDTCWEYSAGISQVIDVVDDFKAVDFEWVDDPSGGDF